MYCTVFDYILSRQYDIQYGYSIVEHGPYHSTECIKHESSTVFKI